MYDEKTIINLGLGLLGQHSITSYANPANPLERRVVPAYAHQRRSELIKRRWVFNRHFASLTIRPDATMNTAERPYAFDLPNDYLAAVRDRTTTWQIRGNLLYSRYDSVVLEYKADVPEVQFDPLFVDVLAARIAVDNAEWITQSNIKKADADDRFYKPAIQMAAANNALIIGSEDETGALDEDDTWLHARAGYNL